MTTKKQFDMWTEGGLKQNREDGLSASDILCTKEKKITDISIDVLALETLLTDCGATSVSHLRWVLTRLNPDLYTTVMKVDVLIIFPFIAERHCSGLEEKIQSFVVS